MEYVTYDVLIQLGLLIVAIIGLVHKISHKDEKYYWQGVPLSTTFK